MVIFQLIKKLQRKSAILSRFLSTIYKWTNHDESEKCFNYSPSCVSFACYIFICKQHATWLLFRHFTVSHEIAHSPWTVKFSSKCVALLLQCVDVQYSELIELSVSGPDSLLTLLLFALLNPWP